MDKREEKIIDLARKDLGVRDRDLPCFLFQLAKVKKAKAEGFSIQEISRMVVEGKSLPRQT